MMSPRAAAEQTVAAVRRLDALTPLDVEALSALRHALTRPRTYPARRELQVERHEIRETLLILSGWAARVRILPDGRRQIIGFLLPGDLVGLCDHDRPVVSATVIAITDVQTCLAPDSAVSPTLKRAYALSRAHDEAYLLAQVTRLGRLDAQDRIADFLLETLERMELAGLAVKGGFTMPITQEVLADALGLTSVHVNRVVQALRREGSLDWKAREVSLPTPDILRRSVGRVMTKVTAG